MISKIFRRKKKKGRKEIWSFQKMRKKPGDATRLKMVIGVIHTLMALSEVGVSMATDLVFFSVGNEC